MEEYIMKEINICKEFEKEPINELATLVRQKKCEDTISFWVLNGKYGFDVLDFKDNIVTIDLNVFLDFKDAFLMCTGCYDEDSNFQKEICKCFSMQDDTEILGIKYKFNGVDLIVTKHDGSLDDFFNDYCEKLESSKI